MLLRSTDDRKLLLARIAVDEEDHTFLTSNLFFPSSAAPPALAVFDTAFDFAAAEGPASGISTSFIFVENTWISEVSMVRQLLWGSVTFLQGRLLAACCQGLEQKWQF